MILRAHRKPRGNLIQKCTVGAPVNSHWPLVFTEAMERGWGLRSALLPLNKWNRSERKTRLKAVFLMTA